MFRCDSQLSLIDAALFHREAGGSHVTVQRAGLGNHDVATGHHMADHFAVYLQASRFQRSGELHIRPLLHYNWTSLNGAEESTLSTNRHRPIAV